MSEHEGSGSGSGSGSARTHLLVPLQALASLLIAQRASLSLGLCLRLLKRLLLLSAACRLPRLLVVLRLPCVVAHSVAARRLRCVSHARARVEHERLAIARLAGALGIAAHPVLTQLLVSDLAHAQQPLRPPANVPGRGRRRVPRLDVEHPRVPLGPILVGQSNSSVVLADLCC